MEKELDIFNNYYSNYNDLCIEIHRKYEHTMRVVSYAEKIAKSLDLNNEDIILAKKCALFHDIARFKQWNDYNTFHDKDSFDHGDMGCKILKELGINDEIILLSTKYHNKYEIDKSLDERTKLFCNITRDADKIDIMDTQEKTCKEKSIDIPKDIIDVFYEHKLLKNNITANYISVFSMLRSLAFIFDINYKESFKIIKDKDIINLKCNEIYDKTKNKDIKKIQDILNNFINERTD